MWRMGMQEMETRMKGAGRDKGRKGGVERRDESRTVRKRAYTVGDRPRSLGSGRNAWQ